MVSTASAGTTGQEERAESKEAGVCWLLVGSACAWAKNGARPVTGNPGEQRTDGTRIPTLQVGKVTALSFQPVSAAEW